ncbi:hypothetical protein DMENIID0001_138970 [Sergentomyia squamirostris]
MKSAGASAPLTHEPTSSSSNRHNQLSSKSTLWTNHSNLLLSILFPYNHVHSPLYTCSQSRTVSVVVTRMHQQIIMTHDVMETLFPDGLTIASVRAVVGLAAQKLTERQFGWKAQCWRKFPEHHESVSA